MYHCTWSSTVYTLCCHSGSANFCGKYKWFLCHVLLVTMEVENDTEAEWRSTEVFVVHMYNLSQQKKLHFHTCQIKIPRYPQIIIPEANVWYKCATLFTMVFLVNLNMSRKNIKFLTSNILFYYYTFYLTLISTNPERPSG